MHERTGAFFNGVGDIDPAGSAWDALWRNHEIHIAAGTVGIGNRFCVFSNPFGRVDVALLYLQELENFLAARDFLTLHRDPADAVFLSLRDRHDQNRPAAGMVLAHGLHFHVDVAVILIPLADGIDILEELRLIEASGLVEKSDERLRFRFHLFAQDAVAKGLIPLEVNTGDGTFHAFVNRENGAGGATGGVGIDAIVD